MKDIVPTPPAPDDVPGGEPQRPAFVAVQPAPAWRLGPLVIHRPARTGLQQAPWSTMIMLSWVWWTWGLQIFAGGMALTFIIKRYTENPQIMALITTIPVIVFLGPFVSYVSDQVWTRLGRRKPFMLVAWGSAGLAFMSIAFLTQLAETVNGALASIGIPMMSELVILVIVSVSYTTLYDLQAPLEPLFLESVPPHQRGRFFAIRGIFFNCAVLFFFQILWPVFDTELDMTAWLGMPGIVHLYGWQIVYILSGGMFIITAFYLFLCVEETRVPNAPNKKFRELGLSKFAVSYIKDVFLAKELIPFYIVLCIPGLEQQVWGSFGALMQETQFGYTKEMQALWGLPGQLLAMFILTPFAGWYSDAQKRFSWTLRVVLLVAGTAALAAAMRIYFEYAPDDIRMLPSVGICILLNSCVALGTACFFLVAVETLMDFTGREHMRAWVSFVSVGLGFSFVFVLYTLLQLAPDNVLPITFWMAFQQVNGTFGALTGVFVGPMIYEYITRSKMGTINAGRGIFGAILGFAVPNLGAWWVVYYTSNIHAPAAGTYDYTSLYLLQIFFYIPTFAAKAYFIWLIVKGRMPRTGVLEVEGPAKPKT